MSDSICGHDRGQLRTVLKWAASDDARGKSHEPCDCGGPYCVINNDLNDPAKLVEMLVHEGRRLDILVPDIGHGGLDWRVDAIDGSVVFDGCVIGYDDRFVVTPPRARKLLFAWLQLPDGAHKEAEKAIRGVT